MILILQGQKYIGYVLTPFYQLYSIVIFFHLILHIFPIGPQGYIMLCTFSIPFLMFFFQLIQQKELHLVYALSHVCGQDRTLLASILLKIFLHEKLESLLLCTLNDREISMEGNIDVWFFFLKKCKNTILCIKHVGSVFILNG